MKKTQRRVGVYLACSFFLIGGLNAQNQPAPAAAGGQPTGDKKEGMHAIDFRPVEKKPLMIKSTERNPYAKRSNDQASALEAGPDSEEARIRNKISSLRVTGSSRGINNDLKVQMGDIVMEIGRKLPPILPDQSEDLKVIDVTEDSITLGWVDVETGVLTGKTMQVGYDLSPIIKYQLSGQTLPEVANQANGRRIEPDYGVMRIGKQRRVQLSRIAEEDPAKDLPEDIYKQAQ